MLHAPPIWEKHLSAIFRRSELKPSSALSASARPHCQHCLGSILALMNPVANAPVFLPFVKSSVQLAHFNLPLKLHRPNRVVGVRK
jgi:hypothetical protein